MQKNNSNSNNKKNGNNSDIAAKYKEEMMRQYKQSKQPNNNAMQPNAVVPPPQNSMPKPPMNMPPQNNKPTQPQPRPMPQPMPIPEPVPSFTKEIVVETPTPKPEVIVVPELIIPKTPVGDITLTEEQLMSPPMPKIPVSVREEVQITNGNSNGNQKPPIKMPAPERRAVEIDVEVIPVIPEGRTEKPVCKFPTADEIIKAEMQGTPSVAKDIECKKSGTKIMVESADTVQSEHQQGNYETVKTPATVVGATREGMPNKYIGPEYSPTAEERQTVCGYLAVEVLSAKGGTPIDDVTIIVTENQCSKKRLIAMLFTDVYGETASLELPSSSSDKMVYCISVFADGYAPVRGIEVPIYPDIKSIQPISLTSIDEC